MFQEMIHLCKTLHDRLRTDLEPHGIHRGQGRILHFLVHNGPATQVEIGRHLCLRRATITRMLQRMERDGMIMRHRNPEDTRAFHVMLTEHGQHAADVARATRRRIETLVTTELTHAEQVAFRNYLERVTSVIRPDHPPSECGTSATPCPSAGDLNE